MGFFDAMIGNKAQESKKAAGSQDQFEKLKQKYQSVLRVIEQQKVQLSNLHVENNQLVINGKAPSDKAKNLIWDQVKLIDPTYSDLQMELAADAAAEPDFEMYTVKAGDTLSKLAERYYGDKFTYSRIFDANRDILDDANKIEVGQELKIPKVAPSARS